MAQIEVLSVQDVLSRAHSSTQGGWVLPLAQRAFVWRATQISRLVESLLQGFPVGALLISNVEGYHFELGADRVARHSDARKFQLLDGQQRTLSLRASFGGHGWIHPVSGRRHQLWVNLTEPYPAVLRDVFNPNHTAHGMTYHLRWFEEDLGDPNAWTKKERVTAGYRLAKPKTPERGWIRLTDVVSFSVDDLSEWSTSWNRRPVGQARVTQIESIFDAIQRAYTRPCIPVHHLEGTQHDAETLFQIFIRLNSAGTPLGVAEQFFAGVKQQWRDAEERLSPLTDVAGPLKRRDLISLVARTSAKVPMGLLGLPVIRRTNSD